MPGPIITKNPGPVAAVTVALLIVAGFIFLMAGAFLDRSIGEALFGLGLCSFGVYKWIQLNRAEHRDRKKARKKQGPTH